MQSTPLVSIITPVYNGAAYLDDLIVSVRDQDYPSIEHIIIDDGSNDDGATETILKEYPHLRWWTRENKGQYATMNEGLESAKGEFVCFISADDLMTPGAVRCIMEFFHGHPDYDGVYGRYLWIDENDAPYRAQNVIHHAPLKLFRYHPFISHSALFIRKEYLIERALWFDAKLRFVGDYDWVTRIINSGPKLGFINRDLTLVRSHAGQTSYRNASEMSDERKQVLRKHGINQFLFDCLSFIVYWYSACRRLVYALLETGPKGGVRLIRDWWQRNRTRLPLE